MNRTPHRKNLFVQLLALPVLAAALACGGDGSSVAKARAPRVAPPPSATVVPPEGPHPHVLPGSGGHGIHPGTSPSERADEAFRAADPAEKLRRARPVAEVNGEEITLHDLEVRLSEMHEEQGASPRKAFDLERLVLRAVNDRLIAQEARALGMDREEPTASQVERFRRDLILNALEADEILSKSRPAAAEIAGAFDEQYRRVSLRVLTVDDRAEAETIMAEVRSGADLGELARSRSLDPYAPRGGSVERLPRRDVVPEVAGVAFSLKAGELGGPVNTDLGWSIFRVEKFEPPDPNILEKVRPVLRDLVTMEKARALRAALAKRVERKHPVRIDQKVLDGIRPGRLPDGRLVPEVENREAVLARIGKDRAIPAGDYADALLLRWSGVRSEEAARAAAPIILRNLVETGLLRAEAESLGYARRPEIIRAVRLHETRLLVQRYLEEVLGAQVPVSQEELQAYYEAHRKDFPKPPRLRVGQITVATEAEAREVAELLRQGTDLAWLARRRSTDRLAQTGGDRGWMVPAPDTDEINDRMSAAEPGDVVGPFGAPGNFVVLKVVSREEQGTYSFSEVSGNVRSAVFSGKFDKVLDEFMTKLRSRARIEIHRGVIASLRVGGRLVEEGDGERKAGSDSH